MELPLRAKASNAALAKARALYGRRLTAADYRRLAACRTMPQLAAELKALPMYAGALETINAPLARRAQLEALLSQAIFDRYDSLCRYELSSGEKVFHYIIISCEVQEILSCLRCLDAGRPGDYLYKLPDFLQQHCTVDLYALTKVADAASLLAALAGTPYAALLAPLRQIPAGRKLLVYAEPYLEGYRHEALVNLAKEGPGPASPGKAPSLWDYIALDCDIEALSNAGRLIRLGADPATISEAVRRDCTALKPAEWEQLLASHDFPSFQAALRRTRYGQALQGYRYTFLKEGLRHYQYDWCRKWLRFSTDPALVMLCYIRLARCEVDNLDHIIEGVHYGMPADELLSMLVGAEENETQTNQGRVH